LFCADCKTTEEGEEYMGTMSTTVSGRTCRSWSLGSEFPAARLDKNFPDGSIEAARNYCRNPDGDSGGPWCHTIDPDGNWEHCPVPFCAGKYTVSKTCCRIFAI